MHEVGDVNISAVLWTIILIVVGVYYFVQDQLRASEARNREIRKLQRWAAEEAADAERQAAEEFKIAKTSKSSKKEVSKVVKGGKFSEFLKPHESEYDEFALGISNPKDFNRVVNERRENFEFATIQVREESAKVESATGPSRPNEFDNIVKERKGDFELFALQEVAKELSQAEFTSGRSSPKREELVFAIGQEAAEELEKAEFVSVSLRVNESGRENLEFANGLVKAEESTRVTVFNSGQFSRPTDLGRENLDFTTHQPKAEESRTTEVASSRQSRPNISSIRSCDSLNGSICPQVILTQSASDSTSFAVVGPPLSVSGSIRSLSVCAVCSSPTNKHCSRCKAVKYCSDPCQFQHWYNGHKDECSKLLGSPTSSPLSTLSNSYKFATPRKLSPTPGKSDDSNSKRVVPGETLTSAALNKPLSLERVATTNGSLLKLPVPSKTTSQFVEKDATNGRVSQPTSPLAPVETPQSLDRVATNGTLSKPTRILFPYDHFIELFTSNEVRLAPCGLINCGNSCFANVVLQCLTHTRPLAAYLLEGYHLKECQKKDWCFLCELQCHISRVKETQTPFSPIGIVSKIPNIGNHMGNGRQEDAHEFMRFAIDSMQSSCLDKVGGEKAADQQIQETSFIQHTFGGHLRSQVKCMNCNHESYKYENMMDLAVEIHGNVDTLEDALARFTASEWLDGDNKYRCNRCDTYVKAWKRLLIHASPNILTIALKRFQSGKFGKLNKRVVFPSVLNMGPFMSNEGDKAPRYELYGVIVHIDMLNSSYFGHYICYVKDFGGFWYKIDDSQVKEVNLEDVMQQRAYMLLYKRSIPRPTPLMTTHQHMDINAVSQTTTSNVNTKSSEPAIFSHGGINRSKFYSSTNSNGAIII